MHEICKKCSRFGHQCQETETQVSEPLAVETQTVGQVEEILAEVPLTGDSATVIGNSQVDPVLQDESRPSAGIEEKFLQQAVANLVTSLQ
ncbi:unnamed protein product [Linum trigynum]|uniref:Uncharacterized protein n=1 Tax=Linum trigynum TaxID=586398 RepID=A0AAV2FC51_9ROSI